MAHVRKQIRDAAVTLLGGLTTTGAHVYGSRKKVLAASELPALIIETNNENISPQSIHNDPVLERVINLFIRAKAQAVGDVDDVLDTIAEEVEKRISTNRYLGGLCKGLVLVAIDVDIDEESELQIGEMILQYQAIYYTQASTPETSI